MRLKSGPNFFEKILNSTASKGNALKAFMWTSLILDQQDVLSYWKSGIMLSYASFCQKRSAMGSDKIVLTLLDDVNGNEQPKWVSQTAIEKYILN